MPSPGPGSEVKKRGMSHSLMNRPPGKSWGSILFSSLPATIRQKLETGDFLQSHDMFNATGHFIGAFSSIFSTVMRNSFTMVWQEMTRSA